MEGQSAEDKGKITIPWKWREEEGELDLSDPNDLEKAKRLVNQGHGYEKGQQELKAVKGDYSKLKETFDYWDGLMTSAQESGDNSKVIAALEMSGIKMGKSDSGDDDIPDPDDKKFEDLKKEINDLKSSYYNNAMDGVHTQLEAKYDEGKYPKYNRKEVEDFANKKGIRDFEDAYFVMNKKELMELEVKDDKDKTKKHSDKVKKVASKEPGSGDLPAKPIKTHKKYSEATADWISDSGITENLYIED